MSNTIDYREKRQHESTIAMVVVASMAAAMGIFILATSMLPARNGHSVIAWYLLIPTTLLMIGQHAVSMAAGIKMLLADQSFSYFDYNERWDAAGLVTQSLFDIFLLATLCAAFWEPISRTNALAKRRKVRLALIVLDAILGLALIATMIAASQFNYGSCVEHGCDNATHISLISIWNATFGYGFPAFALIAMVVVIVSNILAVSWNRNVDVESPLSRGLSRTVSPAVGLWLITALIFIGNAQSDDGYKVWKVYYASIPYWLAQVVVLSTLQHTLRQSAIVPADPQSAPFIKRQAA
ncbi:hypothetical protein BKA62DRAFT_833559 [Auriculariales sp. MPI-PUGE-AT-0066]|nr:hypothetical protein BKA62DRAFT_833559 [Auriculariales sp. MPI-PUGE-AT-0066]